MHGQRAPTGLEVSFPVHRRCEAAYSLSKAIIPSPSAHHERIQRNRREVWGGVDMNEWASGSVLMPSNGSFR